MNGTGWYALHVMSGSENDVAERLERMDITTMNPTRLMPERRNGVWTTKSRIVFPGYVFAALEMTPERYYAVHDVPGVIRFLGAESPEEIPPEQLAAVSLLGYSDKLITVRDGRAALSELLSDAGAQIVTADLRQRRATIEVKLLDKVHIIQLGIMQPDTREG